MKLVIFDLGGVLVNVEPRRTVERVARETGQAPEAIERIFHDPALLEPFELGAIEPAAYYEAVKARLGFGWGFERFVEEWNGMLSEHPERAALLGRLRDRYRLLILTNTNVLHDRCIRGWPAFGLAHHWVASHEVKLRKPDPKIYEVALRRAQVAARETVYVDDMAENVASARQLGMTAIHCADGMRLEPALESAGIAIA